MRLHHIVIEDPHKCASAWLAFSEPMNLQRVSGRIENLRVVEDKRHIAFGTQMNEAAGLSAAIFAVAGMGGAAVQTSSNSDAADEVTMYSFEIDGRTFAGCTRKATFKNCDVVDLVFERRLSGNELLGIRRPGMKSIWLYPNMSRGVMAGTRHAVRLWLISSPGLSMLRCGMFVISGLIARDGVPDWPALRLLCTVAFVTALVALGIVMVLVGGRFLRSTRAADEVFAAFGYPDPKNVDLQKTSKAYRKAHNLPLTEANRAERWN